MVKIKGGGGAGKGKANECLIAFLAKQLGVRKNAVSIVAGQTNPSSTCGSTAFRLSLPREAGPELIAEAEHPSPKRSGRTASQEEVANRARRDPGRNAQRLAQSISARMSICGRLCRCPQAARRPARR
jgi:hypothetical protein